MTVETQKLGVGDFLISFGVTLIVVGIFMIGMTFNVDLTGATLAGVVGIGGVLGLPVLYGLNSIGRLNMATALVMGSILGFIPMGLAAWAPGLGVPFYSDYQIFGINLVAGVMSVLNWAVIGAFTGVLMCEQLQRRARKMASQSLAADGAPRVGE